MTNTMRVTYDMPDPSAPRHTRRYVRPVAPSRLASTIERLAAAGATDFRVEVISK